MGSTDSLLDRGDHRNQKIVRELLLPAIVLSPAYALAVVAPMTALGYLAALLVPVGIAAFFVGDVGPEDTVPQRESITEVPTVRRVDDRIGGTRFVNSLSNLILMGLASFVLIAVLFA